MDHGWSALGQSFTEPLFLLIQSAIDYPSAASFAKQFDYFNQPKASIQ